jgi:RecA/RadA recombinase
MMSEFILRDTFKTPLRNFDIIVGGCGIPQPSIIELWGVKDSGKTTLAQQLPIWFIKYNKSVGKKAKNIYIDSELKLDAQRFFYMAFNEGVNPEDDIIILQTNEISEIFSAIENTLKDAIYDEISYFIVWDSIADITTKEVKTKDKGGYVEAKITAEFTAKMPIISSLIHKTSSVLLLLNQARQNLKTGMGYVSKRGEYLKHKDLIKIRMSGSKIEKKYGDLKVKGDVLSEAVVEKNHYFDAGLSTLIYITSEGIDVLRSLYESLKAYGIIGQTGAWSIFKFKDFDLKWRGYNEFVKLVSEKPELIRIFEYLIMKKFAKSPLAVVKMIDDIWQIEEEFGWEKTELDENSKKLYDYVKFLKEKVNKGGAR